MESLICTGTKLQRRTVSSGEGGLAICFKAARSGFQRGGGLGFLS